MERMSDHVRLPPLCTRARARAGACFGTIYVRCFAPVCRRLIAFTAQIVRCLSYTVVAHDCLLLVPCDALPATALRAVRPTTAPLLS